MSSTTPGTAVPTTVPPQPQPGGVNFFGTTPTASAPTTVSAGPYNVSQDQGSLSQYYLNEIGAYPVSTAGTGLPSDATTIAAALRDIYDLPPTQLEELQNLLFAAGFYQDAAGQPLTNMASISFGTVDSQTWLALGRALAQSAESGTALMPTLVNRGAAGVGVKQIQGALNPVMGGSPSPYQVNLTNPSDVYQTAVQVFQGALGRNPTQAELSRLTSSLQSQETSYQQGLNTQAETMSQAQYQAKLNSRAALTTPQTGSGPIPAGPFNTPADFAASLVSFMFGPDKVTPSNVAMVTAWVNASGGLGSGNNPLNVKASASGSVQQAGGVQAYATAAQGIQAAANLLASPQYQAIYAALAKGDASSYASDPTVTAELSQWSGGKVSSLKITKAVQTAAATAAQTSAQTTARPNPVTSQTDRDLAGPILSEAAPSTDTALAGLPGSPSPSTTPGAFLNPGTAQSMGAEGGGPNAAPTTPTVPPGQTNPGQQLASPGDFYLPSSTLTSVQPPSASAAAYTAATTGANAVPHLGNEFLSAYQAILSLIKSGAPS